MAASIRENIDYGRNLPEEAIKRAARCAQAEEFIKELPEGYEHDLAQKAGDLSGGQKQRLLIARALAASPEIVVLDDSSSALDYATDAALRRALQREYAGTTRIVVAQRVSSVKKLRPYFGARKRQRDGRGHARNTHADVLGVPCDRRDTDGGGGLRSIHRQTAAAAPQTDRKEICQ